MENGPQQSTAFLPSDRWGRNLTSYTSETKRKEEAAGVLSSGALGCTLLMLAAVCYAYAYPTVGQGILEGASSLADEMQGLRQENALLKAHLRRMAASQKALISGEDGHAAEKSGVRSEARASMRRLLMDTESLLQQQEEEAPLGEDPQASSEGGGLYPEPAEEEGNDVHVAGRTFEGVSSPSVGAPKVGRGAAATSSDAPDGEDSAARGEGSSNQAVQAITGLWGVCQGMYTGVKAVSYNAYQALVVGRTRGDRSELTPRHKLNHKKRGTGTGWRIKEKRDVKKVAKKRRAGRSARNGHHRRNPRRL